MTTAPMHDELTRGAIATIMHAIRPDFDIAGCVAGLRRVRPVPVDQLAFAAFRYARDPANTTPAHIADFGNRAWREERPWPCPTHPSAGIRVDGTCGGCWAERVACETPAPPRRGKPPTPAWSAARAGFPPRQETPRARRVPT